MVVQEQRHHTHTQVVCVCCSDGVLMGRQWPPRLKHIPQRSPFSSVSRINVGGIQRILSLFTELEAKEACDWRKAAGFPQYAQIYFTDSQFPVDISSVKRDHDFLERDLVEPLCRRLNTLNKCASMKVDVRARRGLLAAQ
uniref:Uncharacterized protein n=1 Tax=Takifugu rubripes TaxID=31033 RepID=A0A674N2N6_TAKRU